MKQTYLGHSIASWAGAIARRISDEWDGNVKGNEDDVLILKRVLEESFKRNPKGCAQLIGTTVIEESYFDPV